MLSHFPIAASNRVAWWIIGVGALAATGAVAGLAGLHLAPAAS